MDEKATLVKNWFTKALHDLAVSRKLKYDEQYPDVAIYHCQQAAEKAVKGFLVLHDKDFPKTQTGKVVKRELVKTWEEMQSKGISGGFIPEEKTK